MSKSIEEKWKARPDVRKRIENMETRLDKLEKIVLATRAYAMGDDSKLSSILDKLDEKIDLLEDEITDLKAELEDNTDITL